MLRVVLLLWVRLSNHAIVFFVWLYTATSFIEVVLVDLP